jgi:hypothetical protein
MNTSSNDQHGDAKDSWKKSSEDIEKICKDIIQNFSFIIKL